MKPIAYVPVARVLLLYQQGNPTSTKENHMNVRQQTTAIRRHLKDNGVDLDD